MTPDDFLAELAALKERVQWIETRIKEECDRGTSVPQFTHKDYKIGFDFKGLWKTDSGYFVNIIDQLNPNLWSAELVSVCSDSINKVMIAFDGRGYALNHSFGNLQQRAPENLHGAPLTDKSVDWPLV